MADDESRARKGRQGSGEGRRVYSPSDAGFDRWLVDQLRKLYDEVLDEEVPEDLVKVVRGFDSGPAEFDSGQAGDETDLDRKGPKAEQPARARKSRRAGG